MQRAVSVARLKHTKTAFRPARRPIQTSLGRSRHGEVMPHASKVSASTHFPCKPRPDDPIKEHLLIIATPGTPSRVQQLSVGCSACHLCLELYGCFVVHVPWCLELYGNSSRLCPRENRMVYGHSAFVSRTAHVCCKRQGREPSLSSASCQTEQHCRPAGS